MSMTESGRAATTDNAAAGPGPDGPVQLHWLTMVAEDDGVMIGRPDIASYALFPAEGAQALRMLDGGATLADVASWYEAACGESLDLADFLETLTDLEFLRTDDKPATVPTPVRWRRLGQSLFSWPAWVCYAALAAGALAAMVREPALRPSYHQFFFTRYLSLIVVTLTVLQIASVLVHESFHALAGRRLGLPSQLRLGRRLYYLVAETRLDSLYSVERRRRYLPFLAGLVADGVLASGLTLLAAALRGSGLPSWCAGLCLATAFACLLRLAWQFMFYLETDLYYVLATALRCSDLHSAALFRVRTARCRLLRRPAPPRPGIDWSDRDQEMARWYAPLVVAGYGVSLAILAWTGIPAAVHTIVLLTGSLDGSRTTTDGLLDSAVFLALSAAQLGLTGYVIVRDRRARLRSEERTVPQ